MSGWLAIKDFIIHQLEKLVLKVIPTIFGIVTGLVRTSVNFIVIVLAIVIIHGVKDRWIVRDCDCTICAHILGACEEVRTCAFVLLNTSGAPTEHVWMEKRSGDLSLSVNVPSGASLVPLSLSNLDLTFISFRMYLTSTDPKLQLMNDRRRTFWDSSCVNSFTADCWLVWVYTTEIAFKYLAEIRNQIAVSEM